MKLIFLVSSVDEAAAKAAAQPELIVSQVDEAAAKAADFSRARSARVFKKCRVEAHVRPSVRACVRAPYSGRVSRFFALLGFLEP